MNSVLLTSNLYKPNYGGIENSLYHLARAYQDLGYKSVICASSLNEVGVKLPEYQEDDEISIYRYNATPLRNSLLLSPIYLLVNSWNAYRTYRRIGFRFKPTLTICRFHYNVVLARLAGLQDICYVVPGIAPDQHSKVNLNFVGLTGHFRFQFHKYVQKICFKFAHRVFVFSQNMKKGVESLGERRPVVLCKPGVDLSRFSTRNSITRDIARLKLHQAIEPRVFICVGRLVRAKGIDLAIEAFSMLQDENLELWIVGDGPELTSLSEKVSQLGITSKVIFWGATTEPENYYAAADFFIMCSRYEPLGQTILEAAASGLPIIAFQPDSLFKTATTELLPGSLGKYAIGGSVEGLAHEMGEVLKYDHDDLEMIGKTLRSHVKNNFSWLRLAENISKE